MKNIEKYMHELIESYKNVAPCDFIRKYMHKKDCGPYEFMCEVCLARFGYWLDAEYDPEWRGFDSESMADSKDIPKKPLNQRYASCDFTTYANCPNCGKLVQNCIGFKEERCRKCGQLLDWRYR